VHSSWLEVLTKPLPLHAFWPLQSFCALLQALCPLQELAPMHLTVAPCIWDPLDDIAPGS
jgi:hypothetical protein